MEEKKIIREKFLRKRKCFDKDKHFHENNLINKHVAEFILSLFSKKKLYTLDNELIVGLYFPLNGEPDLLSIISMYKCCFSMPKIQDNEMNFVEYTINSSLEKLGKGGLVQPAGSDKLVPDIIFIPALAYDLNGYRLGFGSGHYDKYFGENKSAQDPIKIGVCFQDNLCEYLPSQPHDIKMDYIITDKITIAL